MSRIATATRPRGNVEALIAAQRIEAALRAGEALLVADGVFEPKLVEIVWRLFEEAAATLRRLPDREVNWLRSCDRAAWPSIAHDAAEASEAFATMVERVRLGEEPVESLMPQTETPTAQAIDRVWLVAEWRELLVGRNHVRDWRILWLVADGRIPVAKIAFRSHCSRRTVYNVKDMQVAAIARKLRALIDAEY